MAYDGKILARVREIIAERKRANAQELSRRRQEVQERIPTVMETEVEITKLMTAVASDALRNGSDAGKAVEAAQARCNLILHKRAELLKSNGYPENYIDEIYDCPDCGDTGYVLGKPCACLKAIYKTESVRELSCMLNIDDQCFENFDLNYYEDVYDPALKYSPRALMSMELTICSEYAEKFDNSSVNLLFRGDTGLGKTFLAASIAKAVSEKGFSVVYDTTISVLAAFELQKFDRWGETSEEVSSRVRRYLDCDLLIIDDLGTEMTTNFTQSALYSLVNGRLLSGGRTIITTNLSEDKMRIRYSPQIVSRLEGEYLILNFAGKDIRAIKRERGLK